jgi:hypothetical protein
LDSRHFSGISFLSIFTTNKINPRFFGEGKGNNYLL